MPTILKLGNVIGGQYSGNAGSGYTNTNSILLDGTDEYINADALQTATSSNTTGTISVWVKPVDATPTGRETIFSVGDSNSIVASQEFIIVNIETDGKLRCICYLSGSVQYTLITDSAVFSDNTWAHIAVVHNGTQPTLYVDSSAVSQTFTADVDRTTWFNDLSNLDNGRIGSQNINSVGNANFFNGNIDEFLYTSDAKNSSAITTIYNSGTPKDESSISNGVSYYRFGDGTGDNWNSGVSSEWQFIDQIGSNNIYTANCEEADVETDTP